MKYKSIKGMNDILPADSAQWEFVENAAREHFSLYGYAEHRTPVLEQTSLFQRSVGELTDIVQKEMYSFEDKGGDMLSLRPEGTASIVRSAIEHNLVNSNSPYLKVYYMGPMYRRERPQKGRFRQFYQIGVENFGSKSPYSDAEVIEMLASYFKKVGLNDWTLHINSLGEGHERKAYQEKLREFLLQNETKFCDDCKRRIQKNPLRVLDCKNPDCHKLIEGHPEILDSLEEESKKHFEEVQKGLDELEVAYQVNPKMVRGLDYYQRTVFEFISDKLGAQATVAAGGRYDSLVKDLGGADISGCGFAIGLERLLMLLPVRTADSRKKVYFAYLGEEPFHKAYSLVQQLRAENVSCAIDYDGKSLKSQMRRADKLGCTHVVILGDEELKNNVAQVKDFNNKDQKNLPLSQILAYFK